MDGYIDEWLVDLQGDGETAGQALEKLYQEMYRPVFLLAASITNDTAMAEDAAHEVFLTLRRQAARYTPGSSGRAWIFSITRNVSRYLLRTARAEEHKIRSIDDGAEFETCVLEDIVIAKAMAALNEAIDLVKKGYSLTIFPEGTRNKGAEGSLLEFKSGAFRVATKAKAPIVPLAITGSRDIMENHHMFMHPAHVTIRVLEPIETEGLTKEEIRALPQRTADIIAAHLPADSGNR